MGYDPTGHEFWFGAFLVGQTTWDYLIQLEKFYRWINDTLHPEYSFNSGPVSPSDFRNSDGTYSIYDNLRNHPDSVFHEQAFVLDMDGFEFDTENDGLPTYASASVTFMTGGWEFDNVDLSLLDFGRAEVSAGFWKNWNRLFCNGYNLSAFNYILSWPYQGIT